MGKRSVPPLVATSAHTVISPGVVLLGIAPGITRGDLWWYRWPGHRQWYLLKATKKDAHKVIAVVLRRSDITVPGERS